MFCPLTLFQVVRIEKFHPKQGSFFRPLFRVPTVLCYLPNWTFHPIFLFISVLFALWLHKPYCFLLSNCNFDSLEWQLGTYCFYVDLETSSKIKLICVATHYYWSIPFSAVNSIFSYYHLRLFFQAIILSTNKLMLSSTLNISSHISVYLNIIWSVST